MLRCLAGVSSWLSPEQDIICFNYLQAFCSAVGLFWVPRADIHAQQTKDVSP